MAKNVFQVHGIDATEDVIVRRRHRRSQVRVFFVDLKPYLIGKEACGTAHFWARELVALGHEVKIIPPSYVKAYVRRNKNDAASQRLATIPGVGFLTASAIAATVPDPSCFRSGREFAAWVGLVPRQNSSGGKERLGRISKQGNRYIRRLLVIGATSMLRYARTNTAPGAVWVHGLLERRPALLVTVAMANKTARIAWRCWQGKKSTGRRV